MTNEERKAALEAIIYAADEPATIEQLATALGDEKLAVQASLDELVASYGSNERGIEVRAVAGGYKLYTKPEHHDVVRRFIKSLRPPLRLTMPALETLAVISYKQPVTAPEIQEIRGVNTSGVLKTLLDKRLITTAGRKEVIGRPILYRTSKEFLMRFGLSDLQELPSLKEFEALAREALGTDEGISEPGAGDESVLDGMTERVDGGEASEVMASESERLETAEGVEDIGRVERAENPETADPTGRADSAELADNIERTDNAEKVEAVAPATMEEFAVSTESAEVAGDGDLDAAEIFVVDEIGEAESTGVQIAAEDAPMMMEETPAKGREEAANEVAGEIAEKSHKAVAGE